MVTTRRQAQSESTSQHALQKPCQSHAAYYQQLKRKHEEERAKEGVVLQLSRRLKKLWFQIRISLGPFMLDPWEELLYFSALITILYFVACMISHVPLRPPSALELWRTAIDVMKNAQASWLDKTSNESAEESYA